MNGLESLITLGLASGALSVTITQSKIFLPLRERIPEGFLKSLLTCPYCFGHWVAFFLTVYHLWPGNGDVVGWLVIWFAIVGVAALVAGGIGFLFGAGGHDAESDS